jgi:polyisoprenoid-binding protein YceI
MQTKLLGVAMAGAVGLLVQPALAAPVQYTLDPSHTYPSFEAPHMGISWWRGKFNKTEGEVILDREAETGTVSVRIDAASIDFGHQGMNDHAVKDDFFNVAEHPTITYEGEIIFADGVPVRVDGALTLLGNTRPMALQLNSFQCIEHPMLKREVCGVDAVGEFNRADFGMDTYADGPLGQVKLRVQAEGLRGD